ncbi:GNAT family N-acetyltransferase [Cohnella yongneupensis]|uniref:GNAT family N-acetyltransferase n=1 Tax=Cohnella yongneupensis TaxID=425006 RepID=A0ABW0QTZ7_9BACL
MRELRLVAEHDWDAIKSIYEEGIRTRNATFQTEAPTQESWFNGHVLDSSLVCVQDGIVVGWASLSLISSRCVYSGVAEVSVYVKEDVRGNGVGSDLLNELVRYSEKNGFWTLQAGIFPENESSVKLHMKHGFQVVGRRERLGKMDDRWRDVLLLERRSTVVGID